MTTRGNRIRRAGTRLPDPPERNPDEATSITYLHGPGTTYFLRKHFRNPVKNPDTTLVTAGFGLAATRQDRWARVRHPDLLIAFDVDPGKYGEDNGYIVDEQGKPPDLVLEAASPGTASADTGDKRDFYQSLGIPEYWRFDHTGNDYGARPAGNRLADGRYEPIFTEDAGEGIEQGYSEALNLFLRWDHGLLVFIDPATSAPILTYEDQKARADAAVARRQQIEAERQQIQERIREPEEENRRLRGE